MKTYVNVWYRAEFFLEWEVSPTKLVEKIKTHFKFSTFLLFFENRAVCEIMWKNTVQPDKPQMTIRPVHFSRRITKSTNTHPE